MLISKFVQVTGLSRDTIRFYVKKGLLVPVVGRTGMNRYQDFDQEQVERAFLIREAQALGFTLRQIAALDKEYTRGMTLARQAAVMREQLATIEQQAERLARLRQYFLAKLAWLEDGRVGACPAFIVAGGATGSACDAQHQRTLPSNGKHKRTLAQ
jgi:MerR family transcriptional regulator, copper efflux regulator